MNSATKGVGLVCLCFLLLFVVFLLLLEGAKELIYF